MRVALVFLFLLARPAFGEESVCYGKVSNGRLTNGVALPKEGPNFQPYSSMGVALGRTYVHSKVLAVIAAAYRALESAAPGKVFVYGETGWASGGRIKPHRTHQNGLSVDYFVPVLDGAGRSVPIPTGITNKYGYAIEFDANAHFEGLTIDFEAIAEHLYQLDLAAKANHIGITQVIFETKYLPKLFSTSRGPYLKAHLTFMQGQPWVRHDEHYHVDFNVSCQPLAG